MLRKKLLELGSEEKLENGFSGREEGKNGYERTGIEHDDGFNYWLKKQTMEEKAMLKNLLLEQKRF